MLLYIVGFFVVILILAWAITTREAKKLQAAREEYYEIQQRHPYDAREHCPHKIFQISQTDYVGFVATNKWCKVCGKDLGPAKLKKSIFGKSWE
jgi:hypothetical protein